MLRTFQSRSLVICAVLVTGFSALSARLIQIQLVDRKRYAENGTSSGEMDRLPAMRGMIVDCNEEVLAKSLPMATVMVDLTHLSDPKTVAWGLARSEAKARPEWSTLDTHDQARLIKALRSKILTNENGEDIVEKHLAYVIGVLARPLGMRREELRAKIEEKRAANPKGYFALGRELPGDAAEPLRDAIEDSGIRGVRLENSLKRWYNAPTVATHVIGYTGEKEETGADGEVIHRAVGKAGIEASMEEYLRGRDGWRKFRSDAVGAPLPGDAESLLPPRAGLNVQLTLDMGIQTIVEEELDAAMTEYQSKRAAVVVMDPKTGAILAMVSRPNFDLNLRENITTNGFNFALQAVYEPGSTFKIVASSGAMNEKLVTPQSQIFCNNGIYHEGAIEVKDHGGYGMLSVEGILQHSSNIGAYKLALQLGNERFYRYVKDFGFGRKTGVLLAGESSGRARNSGNAVDFSRAAYGYALNVTPLQVATAYCAIGNDGSLLKPHIVKALIANDGSVVERYDPEVVSQVVRPDVARKMRTALQKVVDKQGTAPLAAVPGFHVAGKTGTARMHNPNGRGYLEGHYTVSFAGMLPAEDPKFVAVVVIDDPRTTKVTHFGGTIAAPVFGKMAARIANAMNLQPTEPVETPSSRTASR
ncbi:penicillin-binding protein 2 [Luteolibacter ambystomatis]|uniref:Penicillin-binding protein 2 n=1 Tax=Luteolibacter ambystomatis TaxID=2824561 RepID=A0A975IZK9_9BACT|nr:penicillin-binding protein 2 [Luteolibacter ambystomatis]QUE49800.1 penicillin-binding protein 2 [Luteolibacter ambystomatis]